MNHDFSHTGTPPPPKNNGYFSSGQEYMKTTIATYGADGNKVLWEPTTLDQIGKNENFLETAIAETPELLRLETRQSGIHGPYTIFQQLSFLTPQGRQIIPDLLFLTASGHIVVVEVKLFANPELKDRRVIAQAIDYTASLSALTKADLTRLFSRGTFDSWASFINTIFPGDRDPEELSDTLLTNIKTGKIHIVISCDKAPVGLYELARSVSIQSNLSFSLDVTEITPFLPMDRSDLRIMLVPKVRLSTEIVARSAITVTYQQGLPKPGVSIETTSMDEIEENIAATSDKKTFSTKMAREWSDDEIEKIFLSTQDPIVRELFIFTKKHSFKGQFAAKGRKLRASFGFYMPAFQEQGTVNPLQVFNYSEGRDFLKLYMNFAGAIAPEKAFHEYKIGLEKLFGEVADIGGREPSVPLTSVGDQIEDFKALLLRFKESLAEAIP